MHSLYLERSIERRKLCWMLFTMWPGSSSTSLWTLLTLSNCLLQDLSEMPVFSDTYQVNRQIILLYQSAIISSWNLVVHIPHPNLYDVWMIVSCQESLWWQHHPAHSTCNKKKQSQKGVLKSTYSVENVIYFSISIFWVSSSIWKVHSAVSLRGV